MWRTIAGRAATNAQQRPTPDDDRDDVDDTLRERADGHDGRPTDKGQIVRLKPEVARDARRGVLRNHPRVLRAEWIRVDGTLAHKWLDPRWPTIHIGRASTADIGLHGFSTVSRSHATLSFRDGHWCLVHHGSTTTEMLRDGRRRDPDAPIAAGDVALLGGPDGARVTFKDKVPPASLVPAPGNTGPTFAVHPHQQLKPVVAVRLTGRQREILRLFAEDPSRTIDQVASILVLSYDGVRSHLKAIYKRLDLPSRRGGMIPLAVERALELHLLDGPEAHGKPPRG